MFFISWNTYNMNLLPHGSVLSFLEKYKCWENCVLGSNLGKWRENNWINERQRTLDHIIVVYYME